MIDKKKCKWCNSNFGYYRFSDNFWVCRSCGLLTEFNLTAFKIMKGGVNKMGFERIKKSLRGGSTSKIKENQVGVAKSYISIESNFFERKFNKPFIEVFIDRERRLIGLKPSDDNIKGFKVQINQRGNKNIVTVTPREVTRAVLGGIYELHWDLSNELYYFEVKEIAGKKPQTI